MSALLKYWVWLSSLNGIGAVTALRLLNHFGGPERVFMAGARELREVEGVKPGELSKLSDKGLDRANAILADCAEIGCHVISFHDERYPIRLRNIYDPPLVLYVRGSLPVIDEEPVVSIVGTRDCTPYGVSCAESIACSLSGSGIIVATGLARGIDTAAARGALMGGGKVIGIIGSGLFVVYPPENKTLFEDVASHGAIISEYPPKAPAVKTHFPARNRLLSGISIGVAVIEAPARSGALITASRALEQGRDVFSLPGNIDARSFKGSNGLLRDGAIPLLSPDNIISEYIDLYPEKISYEAPEDVYHTGKHPHKGQDKQDKDECSSAKKEIDKQTPVEYIDFDSIVDALENDERIVAMTVYSKSMHIDTIIQNSGLTPGQVLTAITMLEIKGYLRQSSGKFYSLVRPG